MNRFHKGAVITLLLGTVQFAGAQTPTTTERFAEYMKNRLANELTSAGGSSKANVLGTKPTFSSKSQDPVTGRSFNEGFAQMQADSSTTEFTLDKPVFSPLAADAAKNESFGDRFARMQAESSSGEFKLPADTSETAMAKARKWGNTAEVRVVAVSRRFH